MFKKLFNTTLALAIVAQSTLIAVPTASAATYIEVQQMAYDWAVENDITAVNGGLDSFKGAVPFLGRQNWAKYIVEFAKKYYPDVTADTSKDCSFSDLDLALNDVIRDYIVEACQMNLMNGYAGTDLFGTRDFMTRGQIFVTLGKLMNGGTVPSSNPFRASSYDMLNEAGIATVDNGAANIAGIDAMIMLMRASEVDGGVDPDLILKCLLNPEDPACVNVDPGTGTNMTGTDTVNEVKAGTLNVSLGADSPANNSSIPSNGTAPFGKIVFAAAGSDINVRSVMIERKGLGRVQDIDRIYFEKDGTRVSARASLTSDGKGVINFSPALVVKAGSSESLDFTVSLSGVAGSEHTFDIYEVQSSAQSSSLNPNPVKTPTLRTTTYNVGSFTLQSRGTALTHRAGDSKNLEIAQFRISNTSADNKSLKFKSVMLRNQGNGDLVNLTNMALYRDSTKISSNVVNVDGKEVTFTVDDTLTDGQSATYYVRADVVTVDNTDGDTYQLELRNKEDINVIEATTMFKATVAAAGIKFQTYLIEGADVMFARNTGTGSISLNQTTTAGSTDVVVLDGTITVKKAIQLEDLVLGGTTTESGVYQMINKMTLTVGNSSATFTPASTLTTPGSFTGAFDGAFTLNPGVHKVQIKADFRTTASVGTVKFNDLKLENFLTREYVDTQNNITSGVGSIASAIVTINLSKLNIARNDGQTARTIVPGGSEDVVVLGAQLSNTEDTIVRVTQLTLAGNGTFAPFNDQTTLDLYVDNTLVDSETFRAGKASFSSINIEVSRTKSPKILIKGRFSSSIAPLSVFDVSLTGINATDNNSQIVNANPVSLNAAVLTIAGAGSAVSSTNSSTPSASLLHGGLQGVEVSRFNVSAQNDNLRLTDLYLRNNQDLNLANRLGNVSLHIVENGVVSTTKVANATKRDGGLAFENMDALNYTIPAGQTVSFVVKADINNVLNSTDLITDGSLLELYIDDAGFTVPRAGTVDGMRLISSNGQNVTNVTAGTIISNIHRVVRGAPKVALATFQASSENAMEFTVTSQGNRITLDSIDLAINGANAGTVDVQIRKDSINGQIVSPVVSVPSTNVTTTVPFNVVQEINGQGKYVVELIGRQRGGAGFGLERQTRILGLTYLDMFNDANVSVTNVGSYPNVGLPLTTTY